MGRFGDVWKSGKFSLNTKPNPEEGLSNEVVSMMQEVSPEFGLTDASHVVLSALRSRRGLETGRWLSTLATESGSTHQRLPQVQASSASAFDEMAKWMDLLFQQLAELTYEFNKTAANSNLLVTLEHPEVYDKSASQGSFGPGTKIYRGRLTTSQWALGILGKEEKISVYLIPAAMLLAFTAGQLSERDYPPFMEIAKTTLNGRTIWTIGGQPAPLEVIPHLAKELLGDLVRVASGVMSESELFASGSEKPKLGENLAVGYANPQKQPPAATAPSSPANINIGNMSISDACDLVDEAIERDLKALYQMASTLKPDSQQATPTRTKISNLEKFRSKMLAAFEEYTRADQQS
jgi:hypothetical protein